MYQIFEKLNNETLTRKWRKYNFARNEITFWAILIVVTKLEWTQVEWNVQVNNEFTCSGNFKKNQDSIWRKLLRCIQILRINHINLTLFYGMNQTWIKYWIYLYIQDVPGLNVKRVPGRIQIISVLVKI